jgi:hypothetical protein
VLRQANEIKIMIYLRFIYISTKKKKRWPGLSQDEKLRGSVRSG